MKDFCNLPEGYKTNNKMNKASLLELAKKVKYTLSKLHEKNGRA